MTPAHPIQTAQVHVDPNVIDLGVGQPQLELLPLERLRAAAERRFASGERLFLQYGAEPGDGYLRLELAAFLSREYGFPVEPETLFITSGASMGLDLICTLFSKPGDAVFVEEPSYFLALRIFADHGLRPVPIPVDQDGLDLDRLEEALEHDRPAFLYTIPTFQNPGGVTLSAERRARLAALSREKNFLVAADEVYHCLHFTGAPPRPLAAYIDEGNIFSVGSFSKILAPGLRLGWIQAPPERVQQLAGSGLLDSGGGLNPFTSAIVRGVLEVGDLDANLAELRAVYGIRLARMEGALRRSLPGADFTTPQGGYFFWVRLPGGVDAEALLPQAEALGVSYRPGVRFSSQGGLNDCIRLCFAFYEAGDLERGLERLGQALDGRGR
jgi:2-aminoadipate transaminase